MPQPVYILEVTDTTGRRLPGCTGSHTSIAVYSEADLQRRQAEAKGRPELRVTWRRAPEVTR